MCNFAAQLGQVSEKLDSDEINLEATGLRILMIFKDFILIIELFAA